MLSFKKVRTNPDLSYLAALSAILGFVTNRMNVTLTSMESWAGHHYVPKWTEVSISLMICAMGFFVYTMCVKYLPIFEDEHHDAHAEALRRIASAVAAAYAGALSRWAGSVA